PAAMAPQPAQPPAEASAPAPTPAPAAQPETATAARVAASDGSTRMTPAVRRLVREHNVEIGQIRGSGAAGRVTRDDVLAFVASRESQPSAAQAPAAGVAEAQAQPSVQEPAPGAQSAEPSVPQPAAAPSFAPTPIPAPSGGDTEIPLSQMRKGIAAKMTRVKQT